jgi:hypothetical protein
MGQVLALLADSQLSYGRREKDSAPSPDVCSASERPLDAVAAALRSKILESLRRQGFLLDAAGLIIPTPGAQKAVLRDLHRDARAAAIERARPGLARHETRLLRFFARGSDVEPKRIRPVIQEVVPGTEAELLFRYARLHWSVPVSAGYGRRVRFLVFDEHNGKLIGLFGLGDPVFSLGPRDDWIGWDQQTKRERLRYVMDAFVLGAVPPYSRLLSGKLVALLATSDEVRTAVSRKYAGRTSMIAGRVLDGSLALITTTSALGRSSLYNRLDFYGSPAFISVGFTSGSGEFHFSNGVYREMIAFAKERCTPSAKHERWGSGWRSRRELVRAVLPRLGLSRELVYHGVRREIFVAPLADNARLFLRGATDSIDPVGRTTADIVTWFRERWLLPRADRDKSYRDFDPETMRLWG